MSTEQSAAPSVNPSPMRDDTFVQLDFGNTLVEKLLPPVPNFPESVPDPPGIHYCNLF